MKPERFTILFFLIANCVLFGQNYPPQSDLLWVTTPNHTNWLYQLNEKAEIEVAVYRYGMLLNDIEINYQIGPEMMPDDTAGSIKLKNGHAVVPMGTMSKPGFRDCKLSVTIDGKKYQHHIKVGFEPEKLTPYTHYPDDFVDFWEQAKTEAAGCPEQVTTTFVSDYSNEKVDCYLVKIQAYKKDQYVYGYLTVPKKEGKFPVVFSPPGAGIKPMNPLKDIFYAENGYIRFDMEIHGIRPDLDAETYTEVSRAFGNRNNSYLVNGLDDRDSYYMKKVYLSCVRVLDYLTSLPKWDGKNLIAQGGSQGGALALVTTALDPRITACAANHPALSDMAGYKAGRAGGYPHLFTKFEGMDTPEKINTLAYYDVVNFARQIRVPVLMTWGYNDNVCPPTTSYIVYNLLKTRKEALITPVNEHWISQDTRQYIMEWIGKNQARPVAFPGAEGFGRYASGGRGGEVYWVTTLDDGDQEGTLRYAVAQKGPRTILFNVAGTIFLKKDLRITQDDVTIAGESAPGQGICIAGYPVKLNADNVILRYLRFRVGDRGEGEPDGLMGTGGKNIIIDHCSISWSVDESCSIYGNEDTTVQWCMITESLRTAGHSKGKHGYGAIWGGTRASFHHNLLAHHESRVPRLGPHASTQQHEHVDMRNNVFYNWAGGGCYGGEGMHVNIVNNFYKPGPATPDNQIAYRIVSIGVRTTEYVTGSDGKPNVWKPMEHVWGRFYIAGNVVDRNNEVTRDNWTKGVYEQINIKGNDLTFTEQAKKDIRLSAPLEADIVTTHSAQEAYELVLAQAGCSRLRDEIDTRIVEEVRNGTATYSGSRSADAPDYPGLIDSQDDVKPKGAGSAWPALSSGKAGSISLIDSDGDGIPDKWERSQGLSPSDKSDGNGTRLSKEGYTNLEVWLHSLARENHPNYN
ncbi:MAG: acetylxylan esterase [Proteiniphilum sp.]